MNAIEKRLSVAVIRTDEDKDLMVRIPQQHRDTNCLENERRKGFFSSVSTHQSAQLSSAGGRGTYEENHDEERGEVAAPLHPPHRHESVVLAGDDVAQISFVVLLLGEDLHACHQQVVVAEKLLQNVTAEGVAEAFVCLRVEADDFHWDVESLAGRS